MSQALICSFTSKATLEEVTEITMEITREKVDSVSIFNENDNYTIVVGVDGLDEEDGAIINGLKQSIQTYADSGDIQEVEILEGSYEVSPS